MPESVIPGVYIDVRAEGLIRPGIISINNIGIVGTAAKGPINEPQLISNITEAKEIFGEYDMWINGTSDELTLVRALEIAYNNGASSVVAVRVANDNGANQAQIQLNDENSAPVIVLRAKTPGTWGNMLSVNVQPATENAFIENMEFDGDGTTTIPLGKSPLVRSPLNRIQDQNGRVLEIIYSTAGSPNAGQVVMDTSEGTLLFANPIPQGQKIMVSYMVAAASAKKVTINYGDATPEEYTIASGKDLHNDINRTSAWLEATSGTDELPVDSPTSENATMPTFESLAGGTNGLTGVQYTDGLNALLDQNAHIIVAAGQDNLQIGNELIAHCNMASTDLQKRERIAVVGSTIGVTMSDLTSHTIASDRVIFVGPGIQARDNAPNRPSTEDPIVTLPGAYTAAAVAGMLSARDAEVSLTNKPITVHGLETNFNPAQMEQLIKARVLVLEERQGFRVLKGITTSANPAWSQITTRRIVDFAKYGTRSAANPFIGRLNNERVRSALHASVNSMLADMVQQEMLTNYTLEVTATRDDEIRGIARVTMTLNPTFSIDYIRVTMNLE